MDHSLLISLAEEYGTPLYVYFEDIIKNRCEHVRELMSKYFRNFMITYACKANSNPRILEIMRGYGFGVEAVSWGEILSAFRAGYSGREIIFDGVSKCDYEIENAVLSDVLIINVESLEEIDVIGRITEKLDKESRVGVRFNLDIHIKAHRYVRTGTRGSKFGVDLKDWFKAYSRILKWRKLNALGIHSHIGSMIGEINPFVQNMSKLMDIAGMILDKLGIELKYVDIGGGFGVSYAYDKGIDLDKCLKEVSRKYFEKCNEYGLNEPTVVIEPGRYLVAESGILLTKVNYVKESGGRRWILVDAGMNDLIRPALYGAKHRIINLSNEHGEEAVYSIGGPICESSDVFLLDGEFPETRRGDILAILDVGAYGYSMASNYNSRPRPMEILVSKDKVKIIRKRERYEDILRLVV